MLIQIYLKIEAFLISFTLSILLYVYYGSVTHPKYSYLNYLFEEVNLVFLMVMAGMSSLLTFFLPRKILTPSDLLAHIFFPFIILPSFTVPLYTFSTPISLSVFFPYLFAISAVQISLCYLRKAPNIKLPFRSDLRIGKSFIFVILVLALTYLISVYKVNYDFLSREDFEISSVYEIRDTFRAQNSKKEGVAGYLIAWLSKAIIPLLFILGLHKKKYFWVIGACSIQMIMFMISGHKAVFFSLLLVFFVWKLLNYRNNGVMMFRCIVYGAIVLICSSLYFGFDLLAEVFVRRMMILPGIISGFYLDYFSTESFDYYRHTFLNRDLSAGPHPQYLIGKVYFDNANTSANVNIFIAAYSNLGFYAIFIESILLLFFLKLLQGFRQINLRVLLSACAVPFLTLGDATFITCLFTHGLLIIAFLFWLYNQRGADSKG